MPFVTANQAISLDGYSAGPSQSAARPFGEGAVDELRVHVTPVILGAGERLFDGVPPTLLRQVSSRSTDLVTHITYRRAS